VKEGSNRVSSGLKLQKNRAAEMRQKCGRNAAEMRQKCGSDAAKS